MVKLNFVPEGFILQVLSAINAPAPREKCYCKMSQGSVQNGERGIPSK
jgi:hypothetical protein